MLNYIIENINWIMTLIGLEIVFCAIYFIQAKIDCKFIYKLNQQVVINAVETTILLAAIIYAGAPAWLIWSVVVLTVIGIGSVFALKLKYSL